jgi:DnaJ family protein C protein 11
MPAPCTMHAGTMHHAVLSAPAPPPPCLRYTRMGQVFEFPVALSRDVREWQLLAAALVLPPLTSLVMSRCVVRPLLRWHRKRRDAKARAESRKALEQQLSKAAAERALLEPVARRKARAEANKQGLVVLEAVYGVLEEYFKQQGGSSIAAGSGDAAGSSSAAAAQQQQQQQQQQQAADASSQQQEAADASSQQQQDKEHQGSKGAAQGQKEKEKEQVEPEVALYIDVTHALQYLVSGSKLQLHAGVSKLGLMGFADVALGADKQLHVVYCHGRHVQQVTVEDEQRLVLPGPGQEVGQGPQLQALLQRGNARLGLALEARDGAVVQGPEDEAGLRKLVAEK